MSLVTSPSSPAKAQPQQLVVDLRIPVRGTYLPADHGYGLLSAMAHQVPLLHQNPEIGILTVAGIKDKQGKILLTPQSHLRIRLPVEQVGQVYGRLAGKSLKIGSHPIHLGIPEILMLKSSHTLKARIVTIKNYLEPEGFQKAAQKQLTDLGIPGVVEVLVDENGIPLRKTLKIKQHTIVGFSTVVRHLSEEDSIRLQQVGLGGRRRMGCGFFLPE
ncbi:MAG: type I-MYXAN CRISPR-associated protein Cas6/Cmx6 [Thermostichus sp. DG_1_5_bins_95]